MFSLTRVLHFILILIIAPLFLILLTIMIMVQIFTIRIIFARIWIKEGSSWKCIAPISWAPLSSNEPSSNFSSAQCRTSCTNCLQFNLLLSFLFKWRLHIINVQTLVWKAHTPYFQQKCRLCFYQSVPGFCTSTVVHHHCAQWRMGQLTLMSAGQRPKCPQSVHWQSPHTVCPPLTKSTSEKVFNEQSLLCTLCPRAGHWKEQIRYFVQSMERRPTISSVVAIDTSSEELPRKFFREKGATHPIKKRTIHPPIL